ncbi:stage II sporulation protein D [Calderihabitans maritimus]|uniref:stage II sporulation protein D n=1 Tax=Calderihabitans maritimus TaxID=1246530 RepID=UPI001863FA44|nr:stage II sporulation protein D [Calderihabitans maritimus]
MKKWSWLCLVILLLIVGLYPLIEQIFKPFGFVKVKTGEIPVTVKLHDSGKIVTMPLEKYLIGVVAAEMPARFEIEALKAQAVAARTYALKKIELRRRGAVTSSMHKDADLCTNPIHCQGWLSDKEMKDKWGLWRYLYYRRKIARAVEATKGIVITYKGRLIDPVYHSTSGGRTENSEEVWKFKIPYLRSVVCKWDKDAPKYRTKQVYSLHELDRRLGTDVAALPAAAWKDQRRPVMKVEKFTSSGRVKLLRVGNKLFSGTEVRRLLGLNSTNFSWQVEGDQIIFTVTGNGHGVGMCQYGANGLAREGKNYQYILTYYYTGVKLEKYNK